MILLLLLSGCMATGLYLTSRNEGSDGGDGRGIETTASDNPHYKEFPFRIVYELEGETHTIEDSVIVRYEGVRNIIYSGGLGSSAGGTGVGTGVSGAGGASGVSATDSAFDSQQWSASLKSGNYELYEPLVVKLEQPSTLDPSRVNERSAVHFEFGTVEYYLDDPEVQGRHPMIKYVENYETSPGVHAQKITELPADQAWYHFGIHIIEWDFSDPVKH